MKDSRRPFATLLAAAASVTLLWGNVGKAGKHFFLRGRPQVRRDCPASSIGVPFRDYRRSTTRLQTSVVGTIGPDQPFDVRRTGPYVNDSDSQLAQMRKQFRLRRSSIHVGNLQLSRIGVAVDDTGALHASALISHNSGTNHELHGGNAVVRLRLFTGTPGHRSPQTDTTLLHEFATKMWVVGNTTNSIHLAKPNLEQSQQIQKHFISISHVEVVLEQVQQD